MTHRFLLAMSLWIGALALQAPGTALAAGARASESATAPPITTAQIFSTASSLLGIRYRWGGTTTAGLDCSSYLSLAWQVPRQTTDTLSNVAYPISKSELLPGDALNLPTYQDHRGRGHVRLFVAWADPQHSWMWVFEERRPRSIYHVIPYDPRYTPMRRLDYTPEPVAGFTPPLLPRVPLDLADPRGTYSLGT